MITVLRLGHRVGRDKRMTTHCALAARALGADRILYSGDEDSNVEENIDSVVDRWGGDFEIEYLRSWKKFLRDFNGKKVYLSMYGIPLEECMEEVEEYENDVCIVVGGEKVSGEIYEYIDIQVAVTNQPHSEVAALGVFLHEFIEDKELDKKRDDAEIDVVPKRSGKEVQEEN